MQVIHFLNRAEPRTRDAERRSGDGYTISEHAPGDPAAVVTLTRWSAEVERVLREPGRRRVVVDGEEASDILARLPVMAPQITDLGVESAFPVDASPLANFAALADLRLCCPADRVPFAQLATLRRCEISLPAAADGVQHAPALEELALTGVKLHDLRMLASLTTLRHLHLTSLKSLVTLDGIEHLPIQKLLLIHATRLRSLRLVSELPLRSLWITGASSASDVEAIGDVRTLEELRLESGPTLPSFATLKGLTRLQVLSVSNTTIASADASLEPLRTLTALRDITLAGGKKSLRNVVDIEALGGLHALEAINIQKGPAEIASLSFLRPLRKLRSFWLGGTRIRDGDLHVLLDLPMLDDVSITPAQKHYSHTKDGFAAAMMMRPKH